MENIKKNLKALAKVTKCHRVISILSQKHANMKVCQARHADCTIYKKCTCCCETTQESHHVQ